MIDVEFKGVKSKKKEAIFGEAITFFLQKQIKYLPPTICVNIEIAENLYASGYCTVCEPGFMIIELNKKLLFEDQLLTLAHESVHCKQYITRELEMKKGTVYWKKSPVQSNVINDYFGSPWEKEAYTLEMSLYNQFRNNEYYKFYIDKIVQQESKKKKK